MAYQDEVLADAPRVYYRCEEPSGSTVADSSGNGTDQTAAGTYTRGVAGLINDGLAIRFDDSSGTLPLGTIANGYNNATVELWFSPSSIGADGTLFEAGGFGRGTQMWVDADGIVQVWASHNGNGIAAPDPLVVGQTYHIVATHTVNENMSLYINGGLVASLDGAVGGAIGTNGGSIGAVTTTASKSGLSNAGAPGTYDEIAVYPTALSAARVAAHYLAATAVFGGSAVAVSHTTLSGGLKVTAGGAGVAHTTTVDGGGHAVRQGGGATTATHSIDSGGLKVGHGWSVVAVTSTVLGAGVRLRDITFTIAPPITTSPPVGTSYILLPASAPRAALTAAAPIVHTDRPASPTRRPAHAVAVGRTARPVEPPRTAIAVTEPRR